MPGERDLPPACLPGEEPLVDLAAFEHAARAVVTADDLDPAPAE